MSAMKREPSQFSKSFDPVTVAQENFLDGFVLAGFVLAGGEICSFKLQVNGF